MKASTIVGKVTVSLFRERFISLAVATCGKHGKRESGDYAFWTAVLKIPVLVTSNGKTCSKVFGRSLAWMPAGDRFDRMNRGRVSDKNSWARSVYGMLWNKVLRQGRNIKYIRPSTRKEIGKWLYSHHDDACGFIAYRIGGKSMMVRKCKQAFSTSGAACRRRWYDARMLRANKGVLSREYIRYCQRRI